MGKDKEQEDLDKEFAAIQEQERGTGVDEPQDEPSQNNTPEGEEVDQENESEIDTSQESDDSGTKEPGDSDDETDDKGTEEPKEEGKVSRKTDDEPETRNERPERYIPIPKHKEEVEKRKQAEAERDRLQTQLQELQQKNETAQTPKQQEQSDEQIKKFAEEHKMSEDAVRGLLDLASSRAMPKEVLDQLAQSKKIVEETEEQKYFEQEFGKFEPSLREQYPDATDKQIQEAKKAMDQVAHTKRYAQLSLDEVFKLEKEVFDEVMGADNTHQEGGKRGLESSKGQPRRSGEPGVRDVVRKDKDGNYNFEALHQMENGEAKQKLISALDPMLYDAYIDDLSAREQELEVNRQGQTIKLK